MSSFKNASKCNQKTHRERAQPAARAHLGILEKKKDYLSRTREHQRKQRTLKKLKRKALNKNPDEFYFNMVRTGLVDGEHECEDLTPKYTDEQLKLMQTQDVKYINYKRSIELKKIEKLKASLHLIDENQEPQNKHIIFCDTKEEARNFEAAKHFRTHPSMLKRVHNRLTTEQIQSGEFVPSLNSSDEKDDIPHNLDDAIVEQLRNQRRKAYDELKRRQEREQQLKVVLQKLEVKKYLLNDKEVKRKVSEETVKSPAVYKWQQKRKR